MKICGIYKITSPSKKVYIGQSVNILSRFCAYRGLHCIDQPRLYNSLKKHGVDKHKFEILCQCDKSELNNLEVYYIELYQSFNSEFGLNLRAGGDGGAEISEETHKKLSKAQMGNTKSKGKPKSEETKKRMSESAKRVGTGKWMKGHKMPEYLKENLRIKNKGQIPWITGKKMPKEFGEKSRLANPKSIKIIDISNDKIYDSLRMAAKECNISPSYLSQILSGKFKNKTNLRYFTT